MPAVALQPLMFSVPATPPCNGAGVTPARSAETWANAQNQAIAVAGNMVGEIKEYNDPPWFWTDQYDLNIQVAGDMRDADHITRGDSSSATFSIIAMRGAEIVGALSVNATKEMALLRRIIAVDAKPSHADLESPSYDLRTALK